MADRRTVERRLEIERNIWLATVRPDGRPHVTPVWFVFVRSRFWIGTGAGAVKSKNVAANLAVSLALQDGDQPIVSEGSVIVHPHDRPDDVADAFASKYNWDITIDDEESVGSLVLWEIVPQRWLFDQPAGR